MLDCRLRAADDPAGDVDRRHHPPGGRHSAAWKKLAAEAGFPPRLLEQRVRPFVERVLSPAANLVIEEPSPDPRADHVAWRQATGLV